MRNLGYLLYDPKKFITSGVLIFWFAPLVLVGLISFNATAMTVGDGGSGRIIKSKTNTDTTTVKNKHTDVTTEKTYITNNYYKSSPQPTQTVSKQTSVIYKTQTTPVKQTQVVVKPTKTIYKTTYVPAPAQATAYAYSSSTSQPSSPPVVAPTTYTNTPAHTTTYVQPAATTTQTTTTTPTYTPVATGKSLPDTGPGDVYKIAGLAAVIAAFFYHIYSRRLNRLG